MALYTGINAIKRIKNVDSNIIIKVPFYSDYLRDIEFYEKKGEYPSLDYILDYMRIENNIEDTDENYYKYHEQYKEAIELKKYYIEEIDKNNLLDAFECKEISFITRRYDLAEFLQKELGSSEFYFRMIVPTDKLEMVLNKCKDEVGINFNRELKQIHELKDEYDFEVHVS